MAGQQFSRRSLMRMKKLELVELVERLTAEPSVLDAVRLAVEERREVLGPEQLAAGAMAMLLASELELPSDRRRPSPQISAEIRGILSEIRAASGDDGEPETPTTALAAGLSSKEFNPTLT